MIAATILVVDDDDAVRSVTVRTLERLGYECLTAPRAADARAKLRERAVDLALVDVNMPGESGIELAEWLCARHRDLAVVMVTGVEDPAVARVAINAGVHGYIVKPFTRAELQIQVMNALRRRELEAESRRYREMLETRVSERTVDLQQALDAVEGSAEQLDRSRRETIQRLARAVEFRDAATGRHIDRMSRGCELIARRLGLEPAQVTLIRDASPLHDVGKLAVPDRLLLKPGIYTPEERRDMERHTELGYDMLAGSDSPLLQVAATIAYTHHERFDGTGYPRGLAGEAIPIEGRIAAVADVFDALRSDRVYRPAFGVEEALGLMRSGSGAHFDPLVLEAFFAALADYDSDLPELTERNVVASRP